jgi:hypothetical protein
MAAAKRTRLQYLLERVGQPGTAATLVLAGMTLFAFVLRLVQVDRLGTPQLLCDEFIYADVAKHFAEQGRLLLRGEPNRGSLLYPVLLSPAWFAERMETTYAVAKAINAGLVTVAVIPLYLWGRRIVSPAWALLAPVLTLVMPMAVISGLIMTESAFLPAFLLAAYAIALALEHPTLRSQAFVLAAVALATAIRYQGVVLLAILPTALLLVVLLELRTAARGRRIRFAIERVTPFWPTAVVVGSLAFVYLAVQAAGGGIGAYEDVTSADYSLPDTWRAVKLHVADLALTSGIAPFSALIVLALIAIWGDKGAAPAERAFIAVSVAAVAWILIQVGLFSSQFAAGSIVERYLFYVMPLLFLALAVWLGRGMPRPWLATALAATAPVALVLAQPLTAALSISLIPSSLNLFAFYRLAAEVGDIDEFVWLIRVGALAAALAFAVLWRPVARIAIPLGLVAFLLLSSRPAAGHLRQFATASRGEPALSPNPQWIDDKAGGAKVAYLYTAGSDPFSSSRTMLQVNFWNPTVSTVVSLGTPEVCPLPERHGRIDPATGRIVAADGGRLPRYVVADAGLEIAGEAVAAQGQLVLHRATEPLSIRQIVEGIYADSWMGADAAITRYTGPARGQVIITLSRELHTPKTLPGKVHIEVGPLVLGKNGKPRIGRPVITRRATIDPGTRRRFSIRAPAPPFRMDVRIEPTFSAVDFGGGDTRELGAQVSVGFEPQRARRASRQ